MRDYFNPYQIYESDCFVADYSLYTDGEIGVVISPQPFDDIKYFRLQRGRTATPFGAINLEEHPEFIKGISNCECFFFPHNESDRNWILFLELKYCTEENISNYGLKVVEQMSEINKKLILNHLIDINRYNVYFNFSSPENQPPFSNFMLSCDTALRIRDQYNAHFLGFNHLLIATPQYIQIPKKRI